MAAMEDGGIAAMEIVARDLKAMGLYTARALSFAGVEYEAFEHKLTPDQIAIYDAYADAWGIIHQHLDEALKATGVVDRMSGDTLNSQAKGSALSRFECAKQRFFSQVLLSMKMPSLIRAIEAEVAAGHAAVVQLVTTGEAVLERRLSGLSAQERAHLAVDVSPRDGLVDYLRNAFPTRQMRVFTASDGTARSELMVDEHGAPVPCREAMAARDDLIEQLCGMPPIPAALDALIAHFGRDVVAEVTGRTKRIVLDPHGNQKLETRSPGARKADSDAFMAGRKPILAFSDAGGTGRSYHADLGCGSAGKRRIHFLLLTYSSLDILSAVRPQSRRLRETWPRHLRPGSAAAVLAEGVARSQHSSSRWPFKFWGAGGCGSEPYGDPQLVAGRTARLRAA
ncbi:methylase/helicase [Novosphingobium sp. PY1]|nr:methylase/helicase [Novosphingobium sp. PY1]GFM31272.1 methylase/helicase [Novosphingobium sp. PY1]